MAHGEGEQCRLNNLEPVKATQCKVAIASLRREVDRLRATRGSGVKQCFEDERAFQLEREGKLKRIENLDHLRRLMRQGKLVRIQSNAHYDVIIEEDGKINIGEYDPHNRSEYAVLHPHTANLILNLAKLFHEKFGVKLPIVSVTRTIQYVGWMRTGRRVDGRWIPANINTAKEVSSHEFGCSLDIRYRDLSGTQRQWIKNELQRLACAGFVRAVQEGNMPVYHVMDRMIGDPYAVPVAEGGRRPAPSPPSPRPAPVPRPTPAPAPRPRETLPPLDPKIIKAVRQAKKQTPRIELDDTQIRAFAGRVAEFLSLMQWSPFDSKHDRVKFGQDRHGVVYIDLIRGRRKNTLRLQH